MVRGFRVSVCHRVPVHAARATGGQFVAKSGPDPLAGGVPLSMSDDFPQFLPLRGRRNPCL